MDTKEQSRFAICVEDDGFDDLGVWKLYRILPDPKASEVGCLRVIDESGEDYLYPEDRFVAVDFPENVCARFLATPDSPR